MTQAQRPIVVSSGDPAGIGPDLVLELPLRLPETPLVVLGDRDVLADRARQLDLHVALHDWRPGAPLPGEGLAVMHFPTGTRIHPGHPEPLAAPYVLTMLREAVRGCLAGDYAALVTAPLAKSVIREGAEADFTGHTEYLAKLSDTRRVVMMLAAGSLRVALATTHLSLRHVPDAITADSLERTLRILHRDLSDKFAVNEPRILVLGLNPHAGENGHLGREETTVISPVLEKLRDEGFRLTGPVPADTAFTPRLLEHHDAVLAMYHDQGLPVLKYAGFGEAVNVTLGLPFLRTSVDHGTAFDLAGSGRAEAGSLIAATRLALTLTERQSA